MNTYLPKFQQAAKSLEISHHAFVRLCYLLTAASGAVRTLDIRKGSHIQHIQDGKPRALLIACNASLVALPWIIAWLVILTSFSRHPGFFRWMLPGAGISTVAVAMILAPSLRSLATLATFGHVGFGVGYALCSTDFAQRLDARLASPRELVGPEMEGARRPSDQESQTAREDSTAAILNSPATTLTKVLLMVWQAAMLCNTIATDDHFPNMTIQSEDQSMVEVVLGGIVILHIQIAYAYVAYHYLRNADDLGWECACAGLFGGASLISLRYSATESMWPSWIVDGLLAFVGLNIGLLIGSISRGWYNRKGTEVKTSNRKGDS